MHCHRGGTAWGAGAVGLNHPWQWGVRSRDGSIPMTGRTPGLRDVNFVFLQKSTIVLKKIDFLDYRIWASLSRYAVVYYVMYRAPQGVDVATSAFGLSCRSL